MKSTLRQRGAALVVVLMALALLFSMGVPFLFASRLRSESANETYSRSLARISVESASKATAFQQALSHPFADPTPLWDSADEWDGSFNGPMPQSLGSDWERSTESWGAEIESSQAKVSLASAPVMLLQNLVHPCFLSADASYRDGNIPVNSTAGFPDQGFVLVGTRWIQYQSKTPTAFGDLVSTGEEPEDLEEIRFRRGYLVQDPRVQALVLSNFKAEGHLSPEFFADAFAFDFGGGPETRLPQSDLKILHDLCVLRSGAYGADVWEPASWTTRRIDPEHPDIVSVDEGSYFSMGTVARFLPEYGEPLDRLVLAAGGGRLALSAPLPTDFDPLTTRVYPMRREPVDINACRPEVLEALALGVSFRGSPPVFSRTPVSGAGGRDWVQPSEARRFALRVIQARPLKGPQDLWDRVLQPMAEEGAMSVVDAWALYLNGLDPNNGSLRQSTTSFGYRSGNHYLQRINAAVRSRLGRTLARASFQQKIATVPAGELLSVLQDQETLEDATRWGRGMHGVVTLPVAMGSLTGDFEASENALTLQLGTWEETGRMVPEKEPELSAVIPMPARESDEFPFNGRGRVEHFDFDPSPLGRYIPQTGPYSPAFETWNVAGESNFSDVEPLCFQGWFFSEDLQTGSLFELGGFENNRNRVTAAMEQGKLVVRVQGTAGPDDFDLSNLEEEIIVRVDSADYPIDNRWFHLSVLIRDLSHRGVQVMIDGVPRGDIDGFTHLTAALSGFDGTPTGNVISVESTEGFPPRGTLRIGPEIIEYSSKTDTSFVADWDPATYFGGRAIREAAADLAVLNDTEHPVGCGVELYGYSAILQSSIPPGAKTLSGDVGPWAISTLNTGVEDITGLIIAIGLPFPGLGKGINASYVGPIELSAFYQAPEDEFFEEAFQSDGGYAYLISGPAPFTNADDDSNVGGVEVVQYSSRAGNVLTLSERNVRLPGMAEAEEDEGRRSSLSSTGVTHIMEYGEIPGLNYAESPLMKPYLIPISVHATGADDLSYFPGTDEFSEYVQLGRAGDPESMEWIRYDHIVDGHFVRDNWDHLNATFFGLTNDRSEDEITPPRPGITSIGMDTSWMQQGISEPVRPRIGKPVEGRSDAFASHVETSDSYSYRLNFRGVMGTHDHEHSSGDEFVPVFHTQFRPSFLVDSGYGYVGRFDRVAIMQGEEQSLPFWFTVNWTYTPVIQNLPLRPDGARTRIGVTYVAFETSTGIPYTGQTGEDLEPIFVGDDRRQYSRLSKFPNHERPRNFGNLVVGGTASGTAPNLQGFVDEVSLTAVGGQGQTGILTARGNFYLREDLQEGAGGVVRADERDFMLDGFIIRMPGISAGDWLNVLPRSGLLDIDGELIAYSDLDTANGEFTIATDGRGFLGTEVRAHSSGAPVRFMDSRAAAALDNNLDSFAETIQIENRAGFARSGLILVDDELMHAPLRGTGGAISMPRERRGPDGQIGQGILRGRFGTQPATHSAGTLVYSFPNRWMDNYIPKSDSGAGAWMQVGYNEPDAFWRGISYQTELPDTSHAIRVLARSGPASWEDDPRSTPGLSLIHSGNSAAGGFQPLGFHNDRLDLRIMFDWGAGAFDPATFTAVGWTQAPRLRNLVIDYLGSSRIERSQEIVE